MKRHGIRTRVKFGPLEAALAFGAFGLLFERGVIQMVILLVAAAVTAAWWAFTSEP
jgi:hypothetical protein